MAELDRGGFGVSHHRNGDGEVVLSVFGELDMTTAPLLLETVGIALDGEGTVVLDLAGMTFIDSQGIKVLVEANKRAQLDRVRRVVLRSPQPQARKVLEMTGLAKLLTVED